MPKRPWKPSLTTWIFVGLAVGIAVGAAAPYLKRLDVDVPAIVRPLSHLFLNLIKSIIAPLVFSTLVIGIAHTGDIKQVGRMGIKSLVYFEVVTTIALVVGLVAVNLVKPGVGVSLLVKESPKPNKVELAQEAARRAADGKANEAAKLIAAIPDAPDPPAKPQTLGGIVEHLAPASIVKAMVEGDVLQIVIFSVLFALGATMLGDRAKPMLRGLESLAQIMFKFTEVVMKFAPIGVGAAMAYTVSKSGLDVLKNLAMLIAALYAALAFFVLVVLGSVIAIFRVPLRDFVTAVRRPAAIAFATTSSESALPLAMENMERMGVPRRVVGFVLPTGYSFNLDGTTLYLAMASVFVAQAAGIDLPLRTQIIMMLTLMLTSKGVAGVPRASLVILSGTLASFGLPLAGVLVILGVDEIMDMGRTAVNVIGNCLATVVVSKWEGNFRTEPPPPEVESAGGPIQAEE